MNHGNGALEKLEEYFGVEIHMPGDPAQEATYLLVWLWNQGFKIVPLEKTDVDN